MAIRYTLYAHVSGNVHGHRVHYVLFTFSSFDDLGLFIRSNASNKSRLSTTVFLVIRLLCVSGEQCEQLPIKVAPTQKKLIVEVG